MGNLLRNPLVWLTACLIGSLFLLAYPILVIQPFRYQSPRELALALELIRFRPALDILLVIAALIALVYAWQRYQRPLPRIAVVALGVVTAACAVVSRVNVYELMFHPMTAPAFAPASNVKLDGGEKVIAINVRGSARAYPIRIISYHHIVNDVLAGVPIVATY